MKRLFFLYFFILTLNNFAQELSFENVELKDLPSSEVHQIMQDKDGFLWIATDAGLCKYDGNKLITYTVKDGISENVVLKIRQDSKNRLWFSTLSGYFFYYENGHFTEIAAKSKLKKMNLSNPRDFMLGEKDTLFIPYGKDYLFIKVPPENNYANILLQPDTLCKQQIRRYLIRNKTNPKDGVGVQYAGAIAKDSTYKFYLFDRIINASLKNVKNDDLSNSNSGGPIRSDGTVYLPCRNVLMVVQNYKSVYYNFKSDIYKIYLDKDEDLWIGTRSNGVYFYKNADLTKTPQQLLPSLSVTSILQDREGSIWISTIEKGVFQCQNKYVQSIPGKVSDYKFVNNQLHFAFRSQKQLLATPDSIQFINSPACLPQNKILWCFTKGTHSSYYGLFESVYFVRNNTATQLFLLKEKIIHPVMCYFLLPTSNDTVLCAALGHIMKIYKSEVVHDLTPLHFLVNCITKLPDNRILVGSRTEDGIYEYKNNAVFPYLHSIKELHTRINCITADSSGNLWVATNQNGVFCIDSKQQVYSFNEKNGLVSDKVNSLAIDTLGNVWCGSYSGLSKINSSSGLENTKIENFNKNHGITDLEIEKITRLGNTLWCMGKTKLFFFDIDRMNKNSSPPGLYIKSLSIKNSTCAVNDSFSLNHDQNDFRIQFELITYKRTSERTFYYKLNGYDKNWNISSTGDIQYTNIGYGTYTLLVYGANNDGFRSTAPLRITFVIKRPFWFTWWFIAFVIAVLIILIALAARYWKRKIEKKERDKAAINQQLAEFKMTALRSQMNPHFIYNAIGSIQHYILKNEIDQSFNYLSKFSSLIRKILNNSRNEFISLEQEISTLQLYIELEQIRFKHPFKFILTVDDELDMETDIPTMLIQPYIENSIWHGLMPKETEGCLELNLKKVNSTIHIQIIDNGVGRETGEMKKRHHVSKGMSLTEQRIQTLENTSNKKFVTTIIDLKDEHDNPIGTEVNLIIPIDE